MNKHVIILGCRGVPAKYGGFETFAEYLSLHLVKNGWKVTVYCQTEGGGPISQTNWEGVGCVNIPTRTQGAIGTMLFDFRSIVHSLRLNGLFLVLGYNTAAFNLIHRIFGKFLVMNMDGIEWKRQKWSIPAKAWFKINEILGCKIANRLLADNPRIEEHLLRYVAKTKVTVIPYGGKQITGADQNVLARYNLKKNGYAIVVARPEPENSVLEIVSAFSKKRRGFKLIVLGQFFPEVNDYHRRVLESASEEAIFPGAIYEPALIDALRYFSRFYVHGHQVGGTNPSLVEALGAGNAILAHDNEYNRWVAKNGAIYFKDENEAVEGLDKLFDDDFLVESLRRASKDRFEEGLHWTYVLEKYERFILSNMPG